MTRRRVYNCPRDGAISLSYSECNACLTGFRDRLAGDRRFLSAFWMLPTRGRACVLATFRIEVWEADLGPCQQPYARMGRGWDD